MNISIRQTMVALACVLGAGGAYADGQTKPGLWEVQLVKNVVDGHDMTEVAKSAMANMQQMMASMSPQQRQQMEAMLGKQAGGSSPQRICISPAMAAGDKPMMPADVKCEPTTFNRSGNKVNFEFNCSDRGRTTSGKGESLLAAETVNTKLDALTTDNTGRHTIHVESLSRYVGPDCGSIKPADQVMRESTARKN